MRHADIKQLVEGLQSQRLLKKDFVIPAQFISMKDGQILVTEKGEPELLELLKGSGVELQTTDGNNAIMALDPTDYCHSQISEKTAIPYKYYQRMRTEAGGLLDTNVTHWMETGKGNYLVRTFVDEAGRGVMRALLSDSYKLIDNYDILLAAMEATQGSGVKVDISKCDLTERNMYVRFTCPDIELHSPKLLEKYRVPGGSPFNGSTGIVSGFVISNSEVGAGRLSVSPRAVVRACSNGMTFADDAFNRIHLGSKMEELSTITWSHDTKHKNMELIIAQIRDAIKIFTSEEYLGKLISKMEANGEDLKHPVDAVKNVCTSFDFGKEREDEILNAFMKGGDTSLFGISQALTFQAQKVTSGDDQHEMELAATKILGRVEEFDRPVPVRKALKVSANLN